MRGAVSPPIFNRDRLTNRVASPEVRGGAVKCMQEMSTSGLLFWSVVYLALVIGFAILALTAH